MSIGRDSNNRSDGGFNFFSASWHKERALPTSWYERTEPAKPKLKALLCIPLTGFSEQFGQKRLKNAGIFQHTLEELSKHNLKKYELEAKIFSPVSYQEAATEITQLNLQKGDCCLIYFSGSGIRDIEKSNTIPEPLFSGTQNINEFSESVWKGLNSIPKEVHIFIIFDFQFVYEKSASAFYKPQANNLIVLENAEVVTNGKSEPSAIAHSFFFDVLIDIIQQRGAKMRYTNLFDQLALRYYQAGVPQFFSARGFPEKQLATYIFSGVSAGKSEYIVYYSEERKQWELNAGLWNGVLPSLSFMHTRFQLDDGRIVSIKDAYDSYCSLLNFEEKDIENSFSAVLLQNALPKLKIGYDNGLNERMKVYLLNTIETHNIYFIDLVKEVSEAAFLIKSRQDEFYLVRNTDYKGAPDDRAVFFYQADAFEFIKQLEYIAQWQALLELDNSRITLDNEVDIIIEAMEGISMDVERRDDYKSKQHINPALIELQYRNGLPPKIRCGVKLKDGKEGPYFVSFIYLDSGFGIYEFGHFDNEQLSNNNRVVDVCSIKTRRKTIGLQIESFYLDNIEGQKEIIDFLLIAISEEKMNFDPLTQHPLEPGKTMTRSVVVSEQKEIKDFKLPSADYIIKKIPIRIKYDNRSFEETVRQLESERMILVPNDLQKNRWGKRSVKDGFSLSAKVEKSKIPFLFNVTLIVQNNEPGITDGGDVAFLLHDTFPEPVRFEKLQDNTAQITVTNAYEDFTAAAILYDGTELELDLSMVPGLPDGFYAKIGSLKFTDQVETLLARRPPENAEDLQKGRWGGKTESRGKKVAATVIPEADTHLVELTVESTGKEGPGLEVAFLLHDSFAEQIAYRKLVNGKATYKLKSYNAFTAGVYISDGTELEIDLNEQNGYPEKFYYEK